MRLMGRKVVQQGRRLETSGFGDGDRSSRLDCYPGHHKQISEGLPESIHAMALHKEASYHPLNVQRERSCSRCDMG
jgi:hypothetical protein